MNKLFVLMVFSLLQAVSSTFEMIDVVTSERLAKNHTVVFAVQQLNLDKLEQELIAVSTPGSPEYMKHWTRDEVANLTANPNATAKVVAFLTTQPGVVSIQQTLYGEYITAVAPVSTWGEMFNATFARYRNYKTRQTVMRTPDNITIPDAIAEHVMLVYNVRFCHAFLNQHPRPQPEPLTEKNLLRLTSTPEVEFNGYVTPSLINKVYGLTSNTGSSSCTHAIYSTIGQYWSSADMSTFTSRFGLPPATVAELLSGGTGSRLSDEQCAASVDNCAESNLDLQYIYAMCQGPALTNWYDYASDMFTSWITSVANTASPPMVISISYGMSETQIAADYYGMYLLQQFDIEAQKLGLMGTSILVSSGDHGSIGLLFSNGDGCGYDASWPASSPYVTAVGATMGPEAGSHTSYTESVCSATGGSVITSGGGFSIIYSRPSWQSAATSYLSSTGQTFTGNAYFPIAATTPTRGLPDISLMGNAYVVYVGGKGYGMSGTSASAPALGGLVSLVNSVRVNAGLGSLGWLNPTLYAIAGTSQFSTVYNDVVSGNNNNYYSKTAGALRCSDLGWAAASGWDPATGLGTPKFVAWKAYLTQGSVGAGSTANPTGQPSRLPTGQPSRHPTQQPSSRPTPSPRPSPFPTPAPSSTPTTSPTPDPSATPTPPPTTAVQVLQVTFSVKGISLEDVTDAVRDGLKSALAYSLGIDVSLVLSISVTATRRRLSTQQHGPRQLNSAVVVSAIIGVPTADISAAIKTAISADSSTSLVAKYNQDSNGATSLMEVLDFVSVDVTPTATPSAAPSTSAPSLDATGGERSWSEKGGMSLAGVIAGCVVGGFALLLVPACLWYYHQHHNKVSYSVSSGGPDEADVDISEQAVGVDLQMSSDALGGALVDHEEEERGKGGGAGEKDGEEQQTHESESRIHTLGGLKQT